MKRLSFVVNAYVNTLRYSEPCIKKDKKKIILIDLAPRTSSYLQIMLRVIHIGTPTFFVLTFKTISNIMYPVADNISLNLFLVGILYAMFIVLILTGIIVMFLPSDHKNLL